MPAAQHGSIDLAMRRSVTREVLDDLMKELARSAPGRRLYHVYFVGGGTAVHAGWRAATIDADVCADDDRVFRDIQNIKERLDLNIEFARPEDFVPALAGSEDRHVFIRTVGRVSFYHYDPYAQLLAKLVRGFRQDLEDARNFVRSDMVDPGRFRSLVRGIKPAAYAKYPALTRAAVLEAVEGFLSDKGSAD
jgi:hypothetical protein